MASKSIASTMNPTPSLTATLAFGNLMGIFNERSRTARKKAMAEYYADDIVFHEPHEIHEGAEEISRVVQKILDGSPDWVFQPEGPISANHNLVMLSWSFGPPGDPKVLGKDVLMLEGGKIKVLYVLIEGQSEVV